MRTWTIGIGTAVVVAGASLASADVELIGRATVSAQATDLSGLDSIIGSNTPHNRFGGWGSAIAWTGKGNRYIVASDRGPGDGSTAFRCRVHEIEIVPPGGEGGREVKVSIARTVMLTSSDGRPYWGNTGNYKRDDQAAGLRLDPEGVRVSRQGTLWVSEEYGPWIDEFSMDGLHLRRIAPPEKFRIAKPDGEAELELPPHNVSGRQPNRGFEGLAISPRGERLYAVLQSPLIQDGALDGENERTGRNIRVLEVTIATGATREFVYPLSSAAYGVSEILAFGETGLLVLERDGKAGEKARFRSVFAVELEGATDVSAVEALPAVDLPAEIRPLQKRRLVDFMDRKLRLSGAEMPEKIEGLAFGPDLPDGRRLLVVTSDNDLKEDVPSHVWLLAIDAADLSGFMPQAFAAE
jgi:hypothetical protein